MIDVGKNIGFIRNAIESTITFARNLIIHRLKQHASDRSFLLIGHQDALQLGRGAFQTIFERLGPTGVLLASNMLEGTDRLGNISQLATREFIAVAWNQS